MSLRRHWERVSGGMACIPVVYVHKHTGEVRYDKPKSEDKLARSLADAALFKEYDHRVATNAHSPPETLLEDWERHEDQQEILTAWYQHTKTGRGGRRGARPNTGRSWRPTTCCARTRTSCSPSAGRAYSSRTRWARARPSRPSWGSRGCTAKCPGGERPSRSATPPPARLTRRSRRRR